MGLVRWVKRLFSRKKKVSVPVKSEPVNEPPKEEKPEKLAPVWMETAVKELGQREVVGEKDNPRIIEYLQTIFDGQLHDEIPWCAAFANWVLKQSGFKGTGSGLARSFLNYGTVVDSPEYGDLVIFWRESKDGTKGHVGFYVSDGIFTVQVLGGNQQNQVNLSNYPVSQILGYRRPVK